MSQGIPRISLTNTQIKGVLFDLDGTLADTAPDLVYALNLALNDHEFASVPYEQVFHSASHGSLAMVHAARPELTDTLKAKIQQRLLFHYRNNLGVKSVLFQGMTELLSTLDNKGLPFGIVTNKHAQFCRPLMDAMGLTPRLKSIISGDSTAHSKPHTAPMLLAAQQLSCRPQEILYLGDAERDLLAAQAANMQGGIALWGYISQNDDITSWPSDYQFAHPLEVSQLWD